MTENQLIEAIRQRAADADTRTDFARTRPREIGLPATPELIRATEQELGFALQPLHQRLLQTVGNGGFGPGDGLIGTKGGALDIEGRSLCELREALWPNSNVALLPLCDWGDGIWSCVDANTGSVVTMSEFGLFDINQDLRCWFERWLAGENLWLQIVVLGSTIIQNPRTKEFIKVASVEAIKGKPYRPSMR
ncbi:hypothetical protein ACE10Z_30140 [Bradyrhizobium sp. Pha-3]|uniref:hypothetical protein n=1 Tax=Bradyrhizobium sp. Pha-3 TaxID=208375 RepID=UPI0035D43B61